MRKHTQRRYTPCPSHAVSHWTRSGGTDSQNRLLPHPVAAPTKERQTPQSHASSHRPQRVTGGRTGSMELLQKCRVWGKYRKKNKGKKPIASLPKGPFNLSPGFLASAQGHSSPRDRKGTFHTQDVKALACPGPGRKQKQEYLPPSNSVWQFPEVSFRLSSSLMMMFSMSFIVKWSRKAW